MALGTKIPNYVPGSLESIPDQANSIITDHITDGAITAAKIAEGAVVADIADGSITTAKLADAAVTSAKLAAAVAGSGLAGGAGTALSVGVDDVGIEINTDLLRLKDLGVTTAKLNAAAVTNTKLAGGFSKVTVAAGVDETAPLNIPVTGMAIGDEVVAVLVFTAAAAIVTMAAHAGTLTAAADGITPGTPVDNTGNQYLIFWTDLT